MVELVQPTHFKTRWWVEPTQPKNMLVKLDPFPIQIDENKNKKSNHEPDKIFVRLDHLQKVKAR